MNFKDRWEKDGKTQSRVRIVANNVHFMPKRSSEGGAYQEPTAASAATPAPAGGSNVEAVSDVAAWDE